MSTCGYSSSSPLRSKRSSTRSSTRSSKRSLKRSLRKTKNMMINKLKHISKNNIEKLNKKDLQLIAESLGISISGTLKQLKARIMKYMK